MNAEKRERNIRELMKENFIEGKSMSNIQSRLVLNQKYRFFNIKIGKYLSFMHFAFYIHSALNMHGAL